jgi:hypothetical protein
MPGTILTEDDFTGLGSGVTISGRIPPVTENSAAFGVDPNTNAATGGGSGDVKFSGAGVGVKLQTLSMNRAIQIEVNMNRGDETFGLFMRDSQTTPFPRNCYYANFRPNANGVGNGTLSIGISQDYVGTNFPGWTDTPYTYSASGINTVALECIESNHRVIINNAVAHSFTDSTRMNTSTHIRHGMAYYTALVPSTMRVNKFSIFDSIVIQQASSYVVVRVS